MKLDSKFAESLTNALIERIKTIEGNWEKPWFENVGLQPKNLDGKPYQGINNLFLSLADSNREVPVYMTFLRAKKEGLSILSGEKSLPVQYGSRVAYHKGTNKSISYEKYDQLSDIEKENYRTAFLMKHYSVFNVDQTNIKEVRPELYEKLKNQSEIEKRETLESKNPLLTLSKENGWLTPVYLDQISKAFYSPSKDEIHLPKREFFKSDDLFYSTMLHEMSHSTGHSSRLNRDIVNSFGSPGYAKEELVAELSAAIVGQQYNVSKTIMDDNASYLKGWLTSLSKDPEYLNEVLSDVVQATDMVIEKIESNRLNIEHQNTEDKIIDNSTTKGIETMEETTVRSEIIPYAELYAHEENMTLKSLEKRNISVPEDISNAIKRREEILGRLVRNSDPTQEQSLLKEKLEIEDNIRTQLKDFIQNKLQFNIAPHVPVAEKMSALEQSGDYLETNMSRELVLHDGLYRKLPIVQTMPDKAENRAKLEAEDVEYEVLPTNQLRYKGVARLQEGYAMEDNKQNRDFLEANKISFDKLNDNKLFVSMRVQKMALLLASSIILSPVFGIAIMYILNKTRTLDRLLKDRQFTNDEAKRLAAGETIRKTGVVEGKQVEKYYFVDDTTNQLRSIPVNEVRLNSRINGVQLSIKELDDLRNGNIVTGYDEATKQYYEAKLDLNSKSSVQMGFKDLKATKEFNYVPKPNSPDADKKAYVQIHGAQGVNDIWEMGGVNLERDSFLDKYDIEGFYKDYQSSIEDKNFAQAEEKSQAIKDALSESQQMKRSL